MPCRKYFQRSIDLRESLATLPLMNAEDAAKKVLDTMLGHLGFSTTVEIEQHTEGPCLQIQASQPELLIGDDGDRLDDLQYLVNRILRKKFEEAPRIKVDCGHYRGMQEDKLHQEVEGLLNRVRANGKSFQMRPLNAYFRRLVYNVVQQHDDVQASSPDGNARLKRITLSLKS